MKAFKKHFDEFHDISRSFKGVSEGFEWRISWVSGCFRGFRYQRHSRKFRALKRDFRDISRDLREVKGALQGIAGQFKMRFREVYGISRNFGSIAEGFRGIIGHFY